jgi:glycosyltransferase involved in cell wall biosynthesis
VNRVLGAATSQHGPATSARHPMPPARTAHQTRTVLMLAPCPFPTGQGTQVIIRHLASALARAGHRIHLVTYGYGDRVGDLPQGLVLHRTAPIDAGRRSGPSLLKPTADAAILLRAVKVARATGCELLHVHNVEGLALGAALSRLTGRPLVYHAHNALGPELPTYARSRRGRALAALAGDVFDRVLPRAAAALVVFDRDLAALHQAYGVDPGRIHVIPPGLDAGELAPPAPATLARVRAELGPGRWVLYAGNPDAYQNLPLLWASLQRLRERAPDVRVVVATPADPAPFVADLRAAGVGDRVRLWHHRDLDELRALHAAAEVGVCPRVLWTGAPIKVLNYLAAGLPVVACRSGARHVLDARGGALVDATPAAFAAGVLSVLASPRVDGERRAAFARFAVDDQVSRLSHGPASKTRLVAPARSRRMPAGDAVIDPATRGEHGRTGSR